MKRMISKIVYSTVAVLFMAGCSDLQETIIEPSAPKMIHLSMQIESSQTKATTDAAYQTLFETGDAVGVYVFNRQADGSDGQVLASNQKYTFNGTQWISEGGMQIVAEATQTLNFYAYYPYDERVSDYSAIRKEVARDQSTLAAFKEGELLYARNTTSLVSETNIVLAFSHAYSLLEVRLEGDRAIDPTMSVELLKAKTVGEINLNSLSQTLPSDQYQTVKMYPMSVTSGNMIYRALVPAQSFPAQEAMISVEGLTGNFTYKPATPIVLTGNHVQVVKLTLGAPLVP